jgi:hypothetical protein
MNSTFGETLIHVKLWRGMVKTLDGSSPKFRLYYMRLEIINQDLLP